ncbi:MAG: PspC domain-containing protein [Microscillaceae bacterium]|nr:PspC domain-containing protein [Microscillaceae bacterium]
MSQSEETIKAYVQMVLQLQQEQRERPLDPEEMTRIARDLGLSEEDLAFIQKKRNDYLARGKGYSRYEDWDSAIEEYEQALALHPNDLDALYGLANAYKNRGQLRNHKDDLQKAKNYVKKALHVDPHHELSFRLSAELNRGTGKTSVSSLGGLKGKSFQKDLSNLSASRVEEILRSEGLSLEDNRRLRKSNRDKKIFGVCAGIAEYFGIDPTWVRIAFILGVIFGGGVSIPIYILLAFVMPRA